MKNLEIALNAMADQPWGIAPSQGRLLYEFIIRERPTEILELGCGIGTSACYMSAALAELGFGRITSIDRNADLPEWVDSTFSKVDQTWRKHHKLIVSETSYNDELLNLIETQTKDGICEPCFDFCFIDGAHTWEVDGCAFFLCEKLLKPGGWVLFDDLTWTINGSKEAQAHLDRTGMPHVPLHGMMQVMKVFKLLVMQHPRFDSFAISDDWGWARKKSNFARERTEIHPLIELYTRPTLVSRLKRKAKTLLVP